MSNKEFNSVEWLYHKMVIKICNKLQTVEYTHLFIDELEQAKEMHKEETCELAFKVGRGQDYDDEQVRELAEIYYNETYGGGNK